MAEGLNSESNGCPMKNGSSAGKDLSYSDYLQLQQLLSSQKKLTNVHDEHLFIITHHAYELWFKQILVEFDSIRNLYKSSCLEEGHMLIVIRRLHRIVLILKLLCDQFEILETMTPLDFMDFRDALTSGSGFQSCQFRLIENKLGVKQENRIKFSGDNYKEALAEEDMARVKISEEEMSLERLVQRWLERTPGLEEDGFNFWKLYQEAAEKWLQEDFLQPAEKETDEKLKADKMASYKRQKDTFDGIFDLKMYESSLAKGERRISHKAFQGALMIFLYREFSRFHLPFQTLTLLMDVDSQIIKWRHNHVSMVQRMVGNKLGTGGSSGYYYLRSTVADRYKVFLDLFNLATYLIPRDRLPPLNADMKRRLSVFQDSPQLH